MANNTPNLINYTNRDFTKLREELITYIKNYHSDKFKYFNDASTDMMYLEMLAYLGDSLNYQVDKSFNEVFRESAQSRESLIRISQDLGFYGFNPRPSSTQGNLSINVPAVPNEDGSAMVPDSRYLVALFPGMQAESTNGAIFECLEEVNFASGDKRTITPNYDSNGELIDFTVRKAVPFIAGQTKVQRFYVNQNNAKPFMEVFLDDAEVTEIIGVVAEAGNTYEIPSDTDFRDLDKTYVEVEHLAQDKVFVEINPMPEQFENLVNLYTDMSVNYGEWINKPKRFIVRRDKDNKTKLVFGSTLINFDYWNQLVGTTDVGSLANFSINQVLNNYALGEVPSIDSTLFIKFRSGAGNKTNALSNQLINIVSKRFVTNTQATDFSILDRVRSSLQIESSLPAVGGGDSMTNEELRHSVGKIFAANDRAVTYEDVKNLIYKMPSKFGRPFRIAYEEIKPKVLNYSQVNNYVSLKMDELLTLSSTVERENKVYEIKSFLENLPNETVSINQNGQQIDIATSSNQILPNTTSLWLGEKCRLYVLGLDQDYIPTTLYKDTDGIWKSKNEALKLNIKNYLIEKRVIGDWIDIVDASVVNFQIEFKIMADKKNKQKVLIDCLTRLRDYFNVYNWQMNQPIFVSNVQTILQEIDGVIAVVDLKFYNIFGTDIESNKEYSPQEIGRYFNNTTNSYNNQNNKFEMGKINNVIISKPHMFLHCRYPETDIRGYVI